MPFRLHIVHESDPHLLQRLDVICAAMERLQHQNAVTHSNQERIMATLDEILADVTAESAGIDSLGTLITQLGEQVKGLTNGNLPPDVQAKVDAIFTQAEANKAKIKAAIDAAPGSTPSASAASPAPASTATSDTLTAGISSSSGT